MMKVYILEKSGDKFLLKVVPHPREECVKRMLAENGYLSSDGERSVIFGAS